MRQLDALDANFSMARVADVAPATRAIMWVNIVREAGSRPLPWQRWLAADVACEANRLGAQPSGAGFMLSAREMVEAERAMA